jgi:hypothetical protein
LPRWLREATGLFDGATVEALRPEMLETVDPITHQIVCIIGLNHQLRLKRCYVAEEIAAGPYA